jgi:S-adenosylmethionine hydrolase
MTPIVTLTTDWGADGIYSGALKGLILQANPGVQIVDITHSIRPYDKLQGAFVLRSTYAYFPKGSIHILGVSGKDSGTQSDRILFEKNDHYFIGANNGMWGLMFDRLPINYRKLKTKPMLCFPEIESYAKTIKTILSDNSIEHTGTQANNLVVNYPPLPTFSSNVITGQVIFIDTYGNAITNISRDDFDRIYGGRYFRIYINSQRHFVDKINNAYCETEAHELLALFSFTGMLEIAMVNANVKEMLNIQISSPVRIVFEEYLNTPQDDNTPLLG